MFQLCPNLIHHVRKGIRASKFFCHHPSIFFPSLALLPHYYLVKKVFCIPPCSIVHKLTRSYLVSLYSCPPFCRPGSRLGLEWWQNAGVRTCGLGSQLHSAVKTQPDYSNSLALSFSKGKTGELEKSLQCLLFLTSKPLHFSRSKASSLKPTSLSSTNSNI